MIHFDIAVNVHLLGCLEYEGHTGGGLVGVGLAPEVVVAEHFAVVGSKEHQGVVVPTAAVHVFEWPAGLRVQER